MLPRFLKFFFFLLAAGVAWVCAYSEAQAMTAQEILEAVVKQNFAESFRVPLSIKTFKGSRLTSDHSLWFIGRTRDDLAQIFIEFVSPKESKGLRFLFVLKPKGESKAFMYLPTTGKTLPLALEDPSVDVGGTGITMEDIQGFIPRAGEEATLLKDEKTEGRDCYVIQVTLPEGKGTRRLWVSKKDFLVVKSQHVDSHAKVKRTFRVVEFFKTEQGREFPREEEILIPAKNTRIRMRQESAVFGIEVPDEIMDPDKFGTFRWQG